MQQMLIQCICIVGEEGKKGHMNGKKESYIISLELHSPHGNKAQDEEREREEPYFSVSKSGISNLPTGKLSTSL